MRVPLIPPLAAAPSVADPGEQALLARRELPRGCFLAAHPRELTQQLLLLRFELGRGRDDDVHEQVTATHATQVRYAARSQLDDLPGLRARSYVELLFAVECRDLDRRTESRRGHRQRHGAVQVIAVTLQHRVRELVDLDVQVAGRSAARTDLTLAGKSNPHPMLDAGRDPDRDSTPL